MIRLGDLTFDNLGIKNFRESAKIMSAVFDISHLASFLHFHRIFVPGGQRLAHEVESSDIISKNVCDCAGAKVVGD